MKSSKDKKSTGFTISSNGVWLVYQYAHIEEVGIFKENMFVYPCNCQAYTYTFCIGLKVSCHQIYNVLRRKCKNVLSSNPLVSFTTLSRASYYMFYNNVSYDSGCQILSVTEQENEHKNITYFQLRYSITKKLLFEHHTSMLHYMFTTLGQATSCDKRFCKLLAKQCLWGDSFLIISFEFACLFVVTFQTLNLFLCQIGIFVQQFMTNKYFVVLQCYFRCYLFS